MYDEIKLCNGHFNSKAILLTYKDIVILPFEGQSEVKKTVAKPASGAQNSTTQVKGPQNLTKARKQVSQPTGKLSTNNIGIKETLNPTVRASKQQQQQQSSDLRETFTFDQLEYVWKEYSLAAKRKRQDSLYSTLVTSKMTMSSDFQIHLELVNTVQVAEIEKERTELLGFIRSKLRNYSVGLKYTLNKETKKTTVLDNKGIFDKLAEDNSSLVKFRKLFNLDIEF